MSACNPMATKDGVQTIGKEGGWSKEMEEWEEQKVRWIWEERRERVDMGGGPRGERGWICKERREG